MAKRVCPWWLGYVLACPLRRLALHPAKLLAHYVREGMIVLEPGPGMGFFTLDMARMVGASGRVVAVDIQPKMINSLRRRAARAGLLARMDMRVADNSSLGVNDLRGKVDFTLAYAVVHEMPSAEHFFSEAAQCSKPGATLLFSEPSGHLTEDEFQKELDGALQAGFELTDRITLRGTHTVVLRKRANAQI
jgi:ubiquinone/menaquinone biosynthesis C-methylase UbiE